MGYEGFPFIVGWELTLACNLRCSHCGSSAGLARPDELSLREAIALCDQFPALLVQEVNFTGGEPLLRLDWFEIAVHLRKIGITTKMITNGLALKTDTITRLIDAGIASIGVSLDGLEENHNHLRDFPGLFRHVVSGIKNLLDADLPVTVLTTVNALNVSELPSMYEYLLSLGVRHWQVQPVFPLGRVREMPHLQLTDAAYMSFGEFVSQYSQRALRNGMEILPGDSFGYFTEYDIRTPPWRGCPAGLFSCGITSDGKVKGCLSMPDELVEGDLRKNDLWEIWFDAESFQYNRNYSFEMLGENCQECDKANFCQGGCSTMSYGATETFHNDPFCFYRMQKIGSAPVKNRRLPNQSFQRGTR